MGAEYTEKEIPEKIYNTLIARSNGVKRGAIGTRTKLVVIWKSRNHRVFRWLKKGGARQGVIKATMTLESKPGAVRDWQEGRKENWLF